MSSYLFFTNSLSFLKNHFFGKNYNESLFLFITDSLILDTFVKTTTWITSICSTVCWEVVNVGFTIDYNSRMYIFSWDIFFRNSINITCTCYINQSLFLFFYFLIFSHNVLLINSISLSFQLWIVILSCHLPSCLQLFLFRKLETLVTVDKLEYVAYKGHTLPAEQLKEYF